MGPGGALRLGVLASLTVTLALAASPAAAATPAPSPPVPAARLTATVRTSGGSLNERSGPSPAGAPAGHLADGAVVTVVCEVYGVRVAGVAGTSPMWDVLADHHYAADAYLSWGSSRPVVPWCGVATHAAVAATVHTAGGALTVRDHARTSGTKVTTLADGTPVSVVCRVWGDRVTGTEGTTATWSLIATGRYISEAYLAWRPDQPTIRWCGEGPATLAPATTAAFIAAAVAPARGSMHAYRIPASVTIAQAILESGAGASGLTRVDHNYFGMKCFGDPGPIAVGCRDYASHECDANGCFPTHASFRAYRSATDSYADHGRLLATTPRYHAALAYVGDPDRYAVAIQKAGYATSRRYAANLITLMKRYNLYRYDR